jgi:hypothetical protein
MVKDMEDSNEFEAFTYLFTRLNVPIQQDMEGKEATKESVFKNRNALFLETLGFPFTNAAMLQEQYVARQIRLRSTRLKSKIRIVNVYPDSDESLICLQMNVQRSGTKYNENFTSENFTSFPYTTVLIASGDNDQVILIRKNLQAFDKCLIAAKAIVAHANHSLRDRGLELTVYPMLEKSNFWDIVDSHSGEIAAVEFTIPPPNLPRLKTTIVNVVQKLEDSTRAGEAKIVISAPQGKSLGLSQNDKLLDSLVSGPESGGPTPRLRPLGKGNKWEKVDGRSRIMMISKDMIEGMFSQTLLRRIRDFISGNDQGPSDDENNAA